jgi:CRP/FNR family cyclic AMP-dependent transcriptional regulator
VLRRCLPRGSAGARWLDGVQLGFAAVEAPTASYVEALARLSLFADVPHPQLEALAHSFDEEVFAEGQRVIRQDVTGGGFYVILDGEAKVVIDGQERARLTRGDFFGEISILTEEAPTADVIATSLLRCLIIPDNELKTFLLKQPSVMYRMLQIEARRLRAANVWNG